MTRSRVKNDFAVGIDDTATATAITIDSSKNVGIGTETPDSKLVVHGVNGSASRIHISSGSAGQQTFTGSGSGLLLTAQNMNTTSKFTPAIQFGSKDVDFTTTNPKVGAAINGIASQTYSTDDRGGMDLAFYTTPNTPGTGQTTTERMRILAEGGLTFNGDTATANALDDYEEGTWTPSWASGSISHDATYTKIGNVVVCRFYMAATSACSGDITGLPFAPNDESAGAVGYHTNATSEPYTILVQGAPASQINFRYGSTSRGLESGKQARGMFVYTTDS